MPTRPLFLGALLLLPSCTEPLAAFDEARVSVESFHSVNGDEEILLVGRSLTLGATDESCPSLAADAEVHFGPAQAPVFDRGGKRWEELSSCGGDVGVSCETCHRPEAFLEGSLDASETTIVDVERGDERLAMTVAGLTNDGHLVHQNKSLQFDAGDEVLLDWRVANGGRAEVIGLLTNRAGEAVPGEMTVNVEDGLVRVTLPAGARGIFRLSVVANTTLAVEDCQGVASCSAALSSSWDRVIAVD